jgi:hypothetical protein
VLSTSSITDETLTGSTGGCPNLRVVVDVRIRRR